MRQARSLLHQVFLARGFLGVRQRHELNPKAYSRADGKEPLIKKKPKVKGWRVHFSYSRGMQ